MTGSGDRRHYVTLFAMGTPTSDGDGGYTQNPVALDPPDAWAKVSPATQRDLERVMANTVESKATHIVTMLYHDGVSTNTLIVFQGRQFNVVGVANPDERNIETVAVCVEVLNVPAVAVASDWVQQGWIQ